MNIEAATAPPSSGDFVEPIIEWWLVCVGEGERGQSKVVEGWVPVVISGGSGRTLKRAPRMERMMIAKTETTTL